MNDEKSGLILILCASLQLLGRKSTSLYYIWTPKSFRAFSELVFFGQALEQPTSAQKRLQIRLSLE